MKIFAVAAVGALFLSACTDTQTSVSANRMVTIGNTTGVTMTRFYASNITRSSWEEDIFGSDVLPSGRSINVNIDDGTGACLFDLKAVFADGDVVTQKNFNVCVESRWTVS